MTHVLKAPSFYTGTFAVNHAGFPPLLTEMLTKAFGYNASPDYLVFQSTPIPHLHRYDARVHIGPGPVVDGQPLVFQGRAMPTADLAIQAVAMEAILYLQTKFPQVAQKAGVLLFPHCGRSRNSAFSRYPRR